MGFYCLEKPMMQPSSRKVVHRSPTHSVWLLSLPHVQSDPVEAESSLEKDFVHLAALFHAVTSIKHQPFHLTTKVGGYTPDFLIGFRDRSQCVVEVKPQELLSGHEEKLADAAELLRAHDLHFVLALDTSIRADDRHENALLLRRYAKGRVNTFSQGRLLETLSIGPQSVGKLRDLGFTIADLAQAVCHHKISLGANLRLDDDQEVFLVDKQVSTEGVSHAVQFERWLANS